MCHPRSLGNLGPGHTFDEAQAKGLAIGRGQRLNRVQRRKRVGSGFHRRHRLVHFHPWTGTTAVITGSIAGYCREAAPHRTRLAKALELPHGSKKYVLNQVLGTRRRHMRRQIAVDHTSPLPVNYSEGYPIGIHPIYGCCCHWDMDFGEQGARHVYFAEIPARSSAEGGFPLNR